MTALYLDASAVIKLLIQERESAALGAFLRGRQLVSSRVATVEVMKAVARSNPAVDPFTVLDRLTIVELDAALARKAGSTGGPELRALDSIHVASALHLGALIDAFVTYDERQAVAARDAGLSVVAPQDA